MFSPINLSGDNRKTSAFSHRDKRHFRLRKEDPAGRLAFPRQSSRRSAPLFRGYPGNCGSPYLPQRRTLSLPHMTQRVPAGGRCVGRIVVLLTAKLVHAANRRQAALLRMRVISEVNHHIRNARFVFPVLRSLGLLRCMQFSGSTERYSISARLVARTVSCTGATSHARQWGFHLLTTKA